MLGGQHNDSHQPRTLIVGLGKTGLSCVQLLAQEGVPLAVVDSREQPPGLAMLRERYPDMAVFLGGFDAHAFTAAERIVVSPGVSVAEPLIAQAASRGTPVIGDIELFAQRADAPVIGVTGSNGKTTVTHLIYDMLVAAKHQVLMGGNVGTPALELLEAPRPDYYLLELSSFQLETSYSLNPVVAVLLNLSPDHLDRYASLDEYLTAKLRIFHGDGVIVLNRDDAPLRHLSFPDRRVITFGLSEPAPGEFGIRQEKGTTWLAAGETLLMKAGQLQLAGTHNVANALAALAVGEAMGLPMGVMLDTLRRFQGLPHRTQLIAEREGVRWYNDSKGTNVGAAIAAIQGIQGPIVLIAGGEGKGADFSALRDVLAAKGRAAVLLGRDAALIARAIDGAVHIEYVKNMRDAVIAAQRLAKAGDAVLLSPACASFDMFNNYEHRGDVFTREVKGLLSL